MATKRDQTTLLKQDVLGRVTQPREQREALLDEFERSGMKGLPFARMAGVNFQSAMWEGGGMRGSPVVAPPANFFRASGSEVA